MKGRGGEGGMRGLRRLLSLLAVLGTVLLGATAEARPLPAPGAFELQASNGYSIFVLSIPSSRRGPSAVLLIVRGKAADVSYFAPATVTGSSIQASLGDLGEIDVRFQPSGRARREHPVCSREDAVFDAGFYAGTIQFNGEEGYTQVTATRARAIFRLFSTSSVRVLAERVAPACRGRS